MNKMKHLLFNLKPRGTVLISMFFISFVFSNLKLNAEDIALNEIINMFNSESWRERIEAAYLLVKYPELEKDFTADIILDALEEEINNPISTEKIRDSQKTKSEALKWRYCSAICSLGTDIVPYLEKSVKAATGEYKDWLIIALGFLKSESAHLLLHDIYLNNQNFWFRFDAIRALKGYRDSTDINIFKIALQDTTKVKKGIDKYGNIKYIYPIRPLAAGALMDYGYEISRQGSEFTIVKEPK